MNSNEYNTQCPICHSGLSYGYNRVQQLATEIAHRTNNHLIADGLAIAYIYIAVDSIFHKTICLIRQA